MTDLLMLCLLYQAQMQPVGYQASYISPPVQVATLTISGPEGWRVVRIRRGE